MLPISFPRWFVCMPGWKRNAWWTLELCLCAKYTLCESLSMQIDSNNVNNVKVPIFTEQAGKKTDLNWTLSKSSFSFEWEIMIKWEDCWEYPDLKSNWLWCLECDMTLTCRIDEPCRVYNLFRDNKEKWNDSHNVGKYQAWLPQLGKAQESKKVSKFCSEGGYKSSFIVHLSSTNINTLLCHTNRKQR